MNKRSLGALIALNLVLLVALAVVMPAKPAYGQLRQAEYLMISGAVTGRAQQNAVFIIELSSARMVALLFDSGNDKVDLLDGHDMSVDFQAQ